MSPLIGINFRHEQSADSRCVQRPIEKTTYAHVAQLVEHVLGKDEVTGSIPVPGSRDRMRALGLARWSEVGFGFVVEVQLPELVQESWPGGGNSTVESRSSKAMVAGSNPVPRSIDLGVILVGFSS